MVPPSLPRFSDGRRPWFSFYVYNGDCAQLISSVRVRLVGFFVYRYFLSYLNWSVPLTPHSLHLCTFDSGPFACTRLSPLAYHSIVGPLPKLVFSTREIGVLENDAVVSKLLIVFMTIVTALCLGIWFWSSIFRIHHSPRFRVARSPTAYSGRTCALRECSQSGDSASSTGRPSRKPAPATLVPSSSVPKR